MNTETDYRAPERLESLELTSAGEHVFRRVPVIGQDASAADLRRALTEQRFDSAGDIAVCDDADRLVGLVTIEEALAAPADTPIRDLMDTEPPVVGQGANPERAAWQAVRHGEGSLAVVDEDGRFIGLIPPHRLLSVLLWEHEEDMSRLSGYLRDTSLARQASEESVWRRFRHRLPWLVVGLLGAVLAAGIVGSFEDELRERVMLAFFIPSIVYMADAVGTQTETLVIRGLSVGIPIRSVVYRELVTGMWVGISIALVFFPISLIIWGEGPLALAVSLSLLAACSTATLVAMALPWLLDRLKVDPAFGSGPLATVVQDIISILIYFVVAMAIV